MSKPAQRGRATALTRESIVSARRSSSLWSPCRWACSALAADAEAASRRRRTAPSTRRRQQDWRALHDRLSLSGRSPDRVLLASTLTRPRPCRRPVVWAERLSAAHGKPAPKAVVREWPSGSPTGASPAYHAGAAEAGHPTGPNAVSCTRPGGRATPAGPRERGRRQHARHRGGSPVRRVRRSLAATSPGKGAPVGKEKTMGLTIVVGYDGSECAKAALDQALSLAGRPAR